MRALLESGLSVAYIVALDLGQAERYGISGYFDYRPWAEEFGIPVYVPETYALTSARDQEFFGKHRFGLLVQGGWQRLFPSSILSTLKIGAIGAHGSADRLPKGRGRSPLNWSLIEGRKRFVLQLFIMDDGADDGDVLDEEWFDITPFDDIRTLYYKIGIVSRLMHLRTLPALLAGKVLRRPQGGIPEYYPKRTPQDGLIRWEDWDVWRIYDFIRALTRPYPGAFGPLLGQMARVWRSQVFDTRIGYPDAGYGEVVERFGDDLVVNCRGGLLLVTDWEAIGKL
ncbi:MAG: methionyl-tRNA formyltransferase [Pseudolabrys sp.]